MRARIGRGVGIAEQRRIVAETSRAAARCCRGARRAACRCGRPGWSSGRGRCRGRRAPASKARPRHSGGRNMTPSAASASAFGVFTVGWPAADRQSPRHWSQVISRMFGRSVASGHSPPSALPSRPSNRIRVDASRRNRAKHEQSIASIVHICGQSILSSPLLRRQAPAAPYVGCNSVPSNRRSRSCSTRSRACITSRRWPAMPAEQSVLHPQARPAPGQEDGQFRRARRLSSLLRRRGRHAGLGDDLFPVPEYRQGPPRRRRGRHHGLLRARRLARLLAGAACRRRRRRAQARDERSARSAWPSTGRTATVSRWSRSKDDSRAPWTHGGVPADEAIRGFHSASLRLQGRRRHRRTAEVHGLRAGRQVRQRQAAGDARTATAPISSTSRRCRARLSPISAPARSTTSPLPSKTAPSSSRCARR